MLLAIGMLISSILSAMALTLVLWRIPVDRPIAKFTALYLRLVFIGYIAVWSAILFV